MRILIILSMFLGLAANPPAESGTVLLLDNDMILEGEIVRVGGEYSIKRASSGELTIPANRAVKLFANKAEAFAYLKQKAAPKNIDEHIKLARWGLLNRMFPEALESAEYALTLNPKDSQAIALAKGIKKLQEQPNSSEATPAQAPSQSEEIVVPTGFGSAAFAPFSTKIQPLLMNLCASCHATGKGGDFKLVRVFEASGNRKGTLQNYAATLNQIDRLKPRESRLLTKAVQVHGDIARAPIKDRTAPTFQTLESWVATALSLDELPKADAAPRSFIPEPEIVSIPEPKKLTPKSPPLIGGGISPVNAEEPIVVKEEKKGGFAEQRTPTKSTGEAKDEFDPAIFNKQVPKK